MELMILQQLADAPVVYYYDSDTLTISGLSDTVTSMPRLNTTGIVSHPFTTLTYEVWNDGEQTEADTTYTSGAVNDPDTGEEIGYGFAIHDVMLEEGDNTIQVTVTDKAGSTITEEVVYTFTTAGDDTAPALTVDSPYGNRNLCGDEFTVWGRVDDPSATVTLTGLGDNEYTAFVQRSGRYWFNDLPLSEGSHTLTIKAEDAAGNYTTETITVSKVEGVDIQIDPLDAENLWQETITVTGSIEAQNPQDYNVWVNGQETTVQSDGTWEATEVPVYTGGVAGVNVTATTTDVSDMDQNDNPDSDEYPSRA